MRDKNLHIEYKLSWEKNGLEQFDLLRSNLIFVIITLMFSVQTLYNNNLKLHVELYQTSAVYSNSFIIINNKNTMKFVIQYILTICN